MSVCVDSEFTARGISEAAQSEGVEIHLEDLGQGTLLRLRHTGLPDGAAAAMHREGWDRYGDRLAVVAGGGAAGPEPLSGRHGYGSGGP